MAPPSRRNVPSDTRCHSIDPVFIGLSRVRAGPAAPPRAPGPRAPPGPPRPGAPAWARRIVSDKGSAITQVVPAPESETPHLCGLLHPG
jgi:hypothetical protein